MRGKVAGRWRGRRMDEQYMAKDIYETIRTHGHKRKGFFLLHFLRWFFFFLGSPGPASIRSLKNADFRFIDLSLVTSGLRLVRTPDFFFASSRAERHFAVFHAGRRKSCFGTSARSDRVMVCGESYIPPTRRECWVCTG